VRNCHGPPSSFVQDGWLFPATERDHPFVLFGGMERETREPYGTAKNRLRLPDALPIVGVSRGGVPCLHAAQSWLKQREKQQFWN